MNKNLIIGVILFSTQSLWAAQLDSFLGRYTLVSSQAVKGDTFCFEEISISQGRDGVSLYRSDVPSVPMFMAPLNDEKGREVRVSHGEALTTGKGLDTVMLKDNVLVFLNETKIKFAGIPAGTESDRYAFKLDRQGRLLAERKVSEPFGTDGQINCVYK